MFSLLADENFNNHILSGLLLRTSGISLVRTQDTSLSGVSDGILLAWAAKNGYILLTHDQRTIPASLEQLAQNHQPIPGVIIVSQNISVGQAIEEILLLLSCAPQNELTNRVYYLPL